MMFEIPRKFRRSRFPDDRGPRLRFKGGGGTNTTVQQSGPPADVLAHYNQVYQQAQNVAGQPYQAYNSPTVAGFTPMQTAGFNNINTAANASQPFLDQGSQYITNAATSLDPSHFADTVGAYQSPYTKQVVDATKAQLNNQNEIQDNQLRGNAASAGAFGGDREAVARAVLAGQQQLQEAPTIANLYNTGYQNATNAAQSNAWLNSQAGFGMGNLGQEAQSLGLTGANAMITAGGQQQQQAQSELNAPYQAFLAGQGYPFQTTNWLEGMATGTGGLSGGSSSTTSPGPSIGSQVAGLGLAGAGLVGATGGFGYNGWLSNAFNGSSVAPLEAVYARGGEISGHHGTHIHDMHDGSPPRHGVMPGLGPMPHVTGLARNDAQYPGGATRPHTVGGFGGVGGVHLPIAGFAPGGGVGPISMDITGIPDPPPHGSVPSLMAPAGSTSTSDGGGGGGELGPIIGLAALAAKFFAHRGGGIEDFARRPLPPPHHFDSGGDVSPGLTASVGGNPATARLMQSYSGLPTEQLREMAVRTPPNSPQGKMVQHALQMRNMSPGADPAKPAVAGFGASGPSLFARGGGTEDDDLVEPHYGPNIPSGLTPGFGPASEAQPASGFSALVDAVHQNEAGGKMVPGIVGDGGHSGGPMQVQQGVLDQVNHRNGTRYTFEDMIRHPEIGKMVGEDHLAQLLRKYSDPALAMGAYNAGEGAMDHAVQSGRGVHGLPSSTQDYIRRGLRFMQTARGAHAGGAIHRFGGGPVEGENWIGDDPMADEQPGFSALPAPSGDQQPDEPPDDNRISKVNPWESVLAAGLGMMAGTSSHPLVNIGQGGLQGVSNYQQQKKTSIQDEMRRDQMRTNAIWRAGQQEIQRGRLEARTPVYEAQADQMAARAELLRRQAEGLPVTEELRQRAQATREGNLQRQTDRDARSGDQRDRTIDQTDQRNATAAQQGQTRLRQGDQRLQQAQQRLTQTAEYQRQTLALRQEGRSDAEIRDIMDNATRAVGNAPGTSLDAAVKAQRAQRAGIRPGAPPATPAAPTLPSWVRPGDQYSPSLGKARDASGQLYGPP